MYREILVEQSVYLSTLKISLLKQECAEVCNLVHIVQ